MQGFRRNQQMDHGWKLFAQDCSSVRISFDSFRLVNCFMFAAGLSSISFSDIVGFAWPKNITLSASFGFVSLFCTSLYTISWNTDPCVQYQIERNPKKLPKFPNLNEFTSPVVLTYKSNKKTKCLHRIVTSMAVGICAYQIYEAVK